MNCEIKHFYIVITIAEQEKYYAYCIKATERDNLLYKLNIKNIKSANIFLTKKKAEDITEFWNSCFKRNGTYLFDNPNF